MATFSDALYSASSSMTQLRFPQVANRGVMMTPESNQMEQNYSSVGMDERAAWSSWRTGGSDRLPADYPCAFNGTGCPNPGPQQCSKSLIMRENTSCSAVTSSADGTGYLTTNWLPPHAKCSVKIGWCNVSRAPLASNPAISQLFLDGKPAVFYWRGNPFLFHTEQTPFIYLVPNAIMVRVSGISYRVDTVSAAQVGDTCDDCL